MEYRDGPLVCVARSLTDYVIGCYALDKQELAVNWLGIKVGKGCCVCLITCAEGRPTGKL